MTPVGINKTFTEEGILGLRYCGIGQFFLPYFGNFLKSRIVVLRYSLNLQDAVI